MDKLIKHKAKIIFLFAALDVFLLVRVTSEGALFHPPDSSLPWMFQALSYLRTAFLLSLAISAIGLFCLHKWGFILSYVQFPLRIIFMHTTFGFLITYIFATFSIGNYNGWAPAIISIVLECVRFNVTIWIQRKLSHERIRSHQMTIECDDKDGSDS